jgi:hypothetical protein
MDIAEGINEQTSHTVHYFGRRSGRGNSHLTANRNSLALHYVPPM